MKPARFLHDVIFTNTYVKLKKALKKHHSFPFQEKNNCKYACALKMNVVALAR